MCFTNTQPCPSRIPGNLKSPHYSLLNIIFRVSFCGESVPKISKTPPAKWKLFLNGKKAMLCFSPFPCHLQLPFSINQLCLSSPNSWLLPSCSRGQVKLLLAANKSRLSLDNSEWTGPSGGKSSSGGLELGISSRSHWFQKSGFLFLTYNWPSCLAVSNHILVGSASGLALDRCSWISVTVEKVQMELMPCIDYTFQNVDKYALSQNVPR